MASVPHATHRPTVELTRQIGLYAATAITVGNIIGSGIFRSPHSVAQELHSVTHPKTGGLYVFIREGFGNAWAFVFGWASLWVIKPTVIASITSVFALYFCEALHLPKSTELGVGIGAIVLLTFVNAIGVREGARTQSVFTTLKMIGILALVVLAFTLHATHPAGPLPEGVATTPAGSAKPLMTALMVAMIPILFAYDGWTDVTYVGGEVVNPQRTLPIAIIWGTVLVIVNSVCGCAAGMARPAVAMAS